MKKLVQVMALAMAGTLVVGQFSGAWAFKKMNMLNKVNQLAQPKQETAQPAQATPAAAEVNKAPTQYVNQKFGYSAQVPGQWQRMSGDANSDGVLFYDTLGQQGSFQVHTNWMKDNFPVQSSLQAMAQDSEQRLKHGELEKYYRKDFTVKDKNGKDIALFQGYVTIEAGQKPDIRRMQWIGYGKGNYYNFTWASKPEQFEAYRPAFEDILGQIQFAR